MYCRNCGTKLENDNQVKCENCGFVEENLTSTIDNDKFFGKEENVNESLQNSVFFLLKMLCVSFLYFKKNNRLRS